MDPLTDTPAPPVPVGTPASQVTALYQAYAAGLVRLAMLMVADQQAAEDVVQDAFFGLYRRWGTLTDPGKALVYVRSSVLNGCRTVLAQAVPAACCRPSASRTRSRPRPWRCWARSTARCWPRCAVSRPGSARRSCSGYCLGHSEEETAQAMKISRGTVKSASSRGLATLARMLKEES